MMWSMNLLDLNFLDLFYNFYFYAFLGWIYESCYVSYKKKTWVNRGFLNGPVIPLYGAAATIVYLLLWNYRKQYLFIFFGGMILATLLEYITSLSMELIFHAKWWDYSDMKYNFQGRICFPVSLFWGLLSLIMIELIQPFVINLLNFIPITVGEYLTYLLSLFLVVDLVLTIIHTVELNKMLGDLQKIKQEFSDYIESTKLYETKEEWKAKFNSYKLSELLENIKIRMEDNKEKLLELNKSREGFELRKLKIEIEKHAKEYLCKLQTRISMTSYIQKRLLKAFPNIKFIKHEEALKDLKERLQKYKRK